MTSSMQQVNLKSRKGRRTRNNKRDVWSAILFVCILVSSVFLVTLLQRHRLGRPNSVGARWDFQLIRECMKIIEIRPFDKNRNKLPQSLARLCLLLRFLRNLRPYRGPSCLSSLKGTELLLNLLFLLYF